MIAIIRFLFEIIEGIFGAVIEVFFALIEACFSRGKKTEYTADFMPIGEVLSTNNKGFCLTGKRSLTIEASYSNALVIGGSGSGKSSRVLIPSILKMMGGSSLVINDPSGELCTTTSGALVHAGYTVKSINYALPELSEGFNPLARARTLSDIQKISKLVIINSLGQGKDPFWNISAEALITLFCRYLIQHCAPEYRSMHNVLFLVNTFGFAGQKLDKLIVKTHDEGLIADYKAFLAYDSKVLMNIIATCRAALNIFSDPSVAKVTAHDTLNFKDFRQRKTALFINNSVNDMRYYSVITSIFLEQFFAEIMSHIPSKGELPVFFLIDEASSLYFNSLNVTISNIRKFKAGILQMYQSAAQLVDLYGQSIAKAITENSYAKVYMTGQPIQVAQELEHTLGKFEYRDEKEVRHIRSLMTADEIRQIDVNESLILCGSKPAIKAKMVPYYEQSKMRRLAVLPTFQPINKLPFETPPLIQID